MLGHDDAGELSTSVSEHALLQYVLNKAVSVEASYNRYSLARTGNLTGRKPQVADGFTSASQN